MTFFTWKIMQILNLAYSKNKQYKILDYWSRDTLKFDFLEKSIGTVSPPHFEYDFLRKIFLVLYSINWPNFVVWLYLLVEILGNMCIAPVCYPRCGVINFEIDLIFLMKLFFYLNKKSRQKFKYLEKKKSF